MNNAHSEINFHCSISDDVGWHHETFVRPTEWPGRFDQEEATQLRDGQLRDLANYFQKALNDAVEKCNVYDPEWRLYSTKDKVMSFDYHNVDEKLYQVISRTEVRGSTNEIIDILTANSSNDFKLSMSRLCPKSFLTGSNVKMVRSGQSTMDVPTMGNCKQVALRKASYKTRGKIPFFSKKKMDLCTIDCCVHDDTGHKALLLVKSIDNDEQPSFYKGKALDRLKGILGGFLLESEPNQQITRITYYGAHSYACKYHLKSSIDIHAKKFLQSMGNTLSTMNAILLRRRLGKQSYSTASTALRNISTLQGAQNSPTRLSSMTWCGICNYDFTTKHSWLPARTHQLCRLCGALACSKCCKEEFVESSDGMELSLQTRRICSDCIGRVKTCVADGNVDDGIVVRPSVSAASKVQINPYIVDTNATLSHSPEKQTSKNAAVAQRSSSDQKAIAPRPGYQDLSYNLNTMLEESNENKPKQEAVKELIRHLMADETKGNAKPSSSSEPLPEPNELQATRNHNLQAVLEENEASSSDDASGDDTVKDTSYHSKISVDEMELEDCVLKEEASNRSYPLDYSWQHPFPKGPRPQNDVKRVETLNQFAIMDTPTEAIYDIICETAARQLDCPVAAIGIMGSETLFLKAMYGLDADREMPRDCSLCAYTIMTTLPFMIPNAAADMRFKENPFVAGPMHVRFYFGFPLVTKDNYVLGTLCVLDSVPHSNVTTKQYACMKRLASTVARLIETRKRYATEEQLERTLY